MSQFYSERVLGFQRESSYSQATDKVDLTVKNVTDKITVEMAIVYPDQALYSEIEMFGIENHTIVDINGHVIIESATTEMAPMGLFRYSPLAHIILPNSGR